MPLTCSHVPCDKHEHIQCNSKEIQQDHRYDIQRYPTSVTMQTMERSALIQNTTSKKTQATNDVPMNVCIWSFIKLISETSESQEIHKESTDPDKDL